MYTGLEKNAPVVVNKRGGEHSYMAFAYHLLDPVAIQELAKVMAYGEKKGYKRDNWRLLSIDDHLNHTIMHLIAYMIGDKQDNHLEHAFTRLMFALAVHKRPNFLGYADKRKKGEK